MWLLGLVLLGISGCVNGTTGYLPLYLRGLGWTETAADGALSTFHASSMLFVVPIALWSDRLTTRKSILMVSALMLITGVGLLAVIDGNAVYGAVTIAGVIRDGFMAVFMTVLIETEGVGTKYMATSMGLVTFFSGLGRLFAPPLGNSLAYKAPALPFVFWACLAIVGFLALIWVKEGKVLEVA